MNKNTKGLIKMLHMAEENYNRKWRLKFHLMPKTGWLNDPNGLCEFEGEYHIFYQYSPFSTEPGINFWGHFTTRDFLIYKRREPMLCCDSRLDCHGVYSGSALADNGKMYIYYTGNVKYEGDYDYINEGREHNTILAVSSNGLNIEEKKLLLKNSDYPENMTCHVRDPKVWKENGGYFMILGARNREDCGEALLYKSEDKLNWSLKNIISSAQRLGYMWECPDYFVIDGVKFLSVCPQGMEAEGERFNNVYQSGYMVLEGEIDGGYRLGEFFEYDSGFDFYAPQTFEDKNGRRILIGWMGLPDLKEYKNPTENYGWVHALTIPRELSQRNGKILQKPLEEFEALRKNEISAEFDGSENFADYISFEADIAGENIHVLIRECCELICDDEGVTMEFIDGGYGRGIRRNKCGKVRNLKILADVSSLEIFINDGEVVFTSRYYPAKEQRGIRIKGENIKATIWEMNEFNYI